VKVTGRQGFQLLELKGWGTGSKCFAQNRRIRAEAQNSRSKTQAQRLKQAFYVRSVFYKTRVTQAMV
jgi:hypothetical protein